ncbi:D-alanyl-D-alanine carboxypeptidase family protein [Streptomyces sp. NBC_01716]|uniref:D-alanyl-D-alanine carboxypeptidase family protein n=1 Tax=Streptomyces sp. NBC_01716 TaxID=2975917 RepID=UPI002E35B5FC|nr:serine hydrolase [Streptomyces sp. NBC_01716]
MIIRSILRPAFAGTVALTTGLTGLLPLLPASASPPTASAATPAGSRADPGDGVSRPADPSLLYRPGTHVRAASGSPAPPKSVSALSWVVADAASGAVLAAHNAHRALPPASTLKTLFAVTALPRIPADSRHSVTQTDLAGLGEGSSLVGVAPGRTYDVADLWRGVFLSSGNDAVRVLAGMNGGWDSTITQMQAKARALGANDTRVVSPDGYDAPGQVSSAYDLAVFGRAGLKLPAFAEYASTVDAQFPGNGSSTFGIRNTNKLLTGSGGVARYPGLIGVKNGYTTHAGNTLVAAARRGDRTLLATVMNPRSGAARAVYEEARTLLDWGFAAAPAVTPVGSLVPPRPPSPPRQAAEEAKRGPVARARRAGPEAEARAGGSAQSAENTRLSEAGRLAAASRAEPSARESAPSGYVWPLVFIGAACLAALTLFLVRRAARRRRDPVAPLL